MSRRLSVALAQISAVPYQSEENRQHSIEAIHAGFERGAQLVVLPEMMASGYGLDPARLQQVAETVPGPTSAAWGDLARARGGYIVGGLCERDGDRLFNTAVAIGPDGGIIGHYRKTHLFANEKQVFTPGDLGFPLVETGFGTIALCVCYDLRFVEVVRLLSLQAAELICVPTAWLTGFDEVGWDSEGMSPQGRATEVQANLSQVFIAAASQVGEQAGFRFLGSSLLADPWGKRSIGPLPGQSEEIAVATIDLDDVKKAQARSDLITPRQDRRTDLYGISVGERIL